MKFNFVYVLVALVALYLAFNINAIMEYVGLPALGFLQVFFKIFFFMLAALCFPQMVGA